MANHVVMKFGGTSVGSAERLAHVVKLCAAEHAKGLMDHGFQAGDLRAIERDNALRLMPRLKA